MAMTPAYWQAGCDELATRCAVMKELIAIYPVARLRTRGNPFQTLARAIVGQQISVKAASSVWNKTVAALGQMTPENLLAAGDETLRAAGLSRQKVAYLQDLAARFAERRIRPRRWHAMDDDAVIAELIAVKGIGRWTAEMFLIFYLMRPNVWPADDIGVIRAVEKLYHQGRRLSRAEVLAQLDRFAPWGTVATWYLWRSIEATPA
jgi:DNA-3-methyladenine glycosylase II